MESVWESPEELHECFLYWQKRALNAEREREEVLDELEFYIKIAAEYIEKYNRLEEIVEDSFSDYTNRILKEEGYND